MIQVFTCFELVFDAGANKLSIDFLKARLQKFSQVFPNFEFLGWYSCSEDGSSPSESDLVIHQSLFDINESRTPLYLMLRPPKAGTSSASSNANATKNKDLPIQVWELVVGNGSNRPATFVEVAHRIETTDVERITVDNLSRLTVNDGGGKSGAAVESSLRQSVNSVVGALQMLKERIGVLRLYLQQVQAGKIPTDHALLREIHAVCAMLPVMDDPGFQRQIGESVNDVLLLTYLATLTKASAALNQLVDKSHTAFDHDRLGNTAFTTNDYGSHHMMM